jgi:hypothetical protein
VGGAFIAFDLSFPSHPGGWDKLHLIEKTRFCPKLSLLFSLDHHFYDETKPFTCLDGSATIPFDQVNDDYCDCKDGSDEPGEPFLSSFFFFFFFFFLEWVWSFGLRASCVRAKQALYHLIHVSNPFCSGYFGDGVSRTICPGWPQTEILQISASQVVRITSVSHWCPASPFVYCTFFERLLSAKDQKRPGLALPWFPVE